MSMFGSRILRQVAVGALLAAPLTAAMIVSPAVVPSHSGIPKVSAETNELGLCPVDAGLFLGSTGSSVTCLQYSLALFGYYGGTLTGEYDFVTSDAVAAFQTSAPPLKIDGIANQNTLIAMGVFSGIDTTPLASCLADAPLSVGSRGPSVQCLQSVLFDNGLINFPPTSVFDTATAEALSVAQALLGGIPTDGVAGQATLAALGIWSGVSSANSTGTGGIAAGPWPAGIQPEPSWNLTAQGIPVFGNRRACDRANADIIATEFARDGADAETQQWAVYVATREGGCDYTTVNFNLATRDDSHCTFQLNALAGMFNPSGELGRRGWSAANVKESLRNCADAASDLWVFCGRGPWTAPTYGCRPPWENDLGAEGDA